MYILLVIKLTLMNTEHYSTTLINTYRFFSNVSILIYLIMIVTSKNNTMLYRKLCILQILFKLDYLEKLIIN